MGARHGIFSARPTLCSRCVFGWFPWATPRTLEKDREAARDVAPLEDLDPPHGAITWVGEGAQTRGALPIFAEGLAGAVYSSRGRGYAPYNEDAGALFRDRRGWMYGAAFDQAGGLGGSVRGQASGLAAREAARAFRELARSTAPPSDAEISKRLKSAIWSAHDQLVERGEGEVTTAVLAVVRSDRAVLVNSGDSGALCFSNGLVSQRTRMHESDDPGAAGLLTHAVGLIPEQPRPETYVWPLSPGDWLVLGSDGLLDFGGEPTEIAEWLGSHPDPADAVNDVAGRILRRMTFMRAKPDNLTVVGIRVADREDG
jgi:serine/threonine protein phosphatase PrpC